MNATDVFKGLPPGLTVREAFEVLSETDAAVWCAYKRRLSGAPLSFDNRHQLTALALQELYTKVGPDNYDRDLYTRLLKHRPMLIEPLRDTHPELVIEKGRQAGVSEMMISKALHALDKRPSSKQTPKVIYTFPRNPQLLDFSNSRIAPIFKETPRAAALITGSNAVIAKRVGRGWLILRSAWESGLGEGVDADMVILDEYDRMKPGVDLAFKESLSSSEWRAFCILSTPTLPEKGVDKFFQVSDQRVWHVRCMRCGHWQEVVYELNLKQVKDLPATDRPGRAQELPEGTYEYVCKFDKCKGLLDRWGVEHSGRWVARYPSIKETRGYHVPQTIMPWISATELERRRRKRKFFQLFCNYNLGITSKGDNVFIDDPDFEAIANEYPLLQRRTRDWSRIIVGIDWGNTSYVVVIGINASNERPYIIGLRSFDDDPHIELASVYAIEAYLRPFDPDMIVADAGYGKDRNTYLTRKFAEGDKHVYACFFTGEHGRKSQNIKPVWSEGRMVVDKPLAVKLTARAIKLAQFGIPSLEYNEVMELREHWKNVVLMRELADEEDDNSESVEKIENTGDDHYAMATVYAWLGTEKYIDEGDCHFGF